jgi:hypothetical protein
MKELKMRAFFGIVGLAGAGFLLSGVTSTVGCSSSSSGGASGSTGAAGSMGHGGSTGTAGTTGTGGTSTGGSGGGGGSGVALGCQASDPAPGDPLIADFSSTDGGSAALVIGGVFVYPMTGGPMQMVTGGAWHVTATTTAGAAAQYWGAGIYFNGNSAGTDCVDATAHTGIQFDISGTLTGTGCSIQYSTNDSAHANNASDTKGSGDSTSYAPQLAIAALTATPTTMMVPFSGTGAPSGGSPSTPLDKSKLTGVQWQLTTAAAVGDAGGGCVLDMTIDNVKFY